MNEKYYYFIFNRGMKALSVGKKDRIFTIITFVKGKAEFKTNK